MKNTRDIEVGKFYMHTKSKKIVRVVAIDKTGFKKHSTVRIIVEDQSYPPWRRVLRSPSLLVNP